MFLKVSFAAICNIGFLWTTCTFERGGGGGGGLYHLVCLCECTVAVIENLT